MEMLRFKIHKFWFTLHACSATKHESTALVMAVTEDKEDSIKDNTLLGLVESHAWCHTFFFSLITSLFEAIVKQSAREADCCNTETNDVFTKKRSV